MIQRLVDVLRPLASDPETQLAHHPRILQRGVVSGDLADALLLVDSCQQERLEPAQRETLDALDAHLERLSSAPAEQWTVGALRGDPQWDRVRRLAGAALRSLGLTI